MSAESVSRGVVGVLRPAPRSAALRIVGVAVAPPEIYALRAFVPPAEAAGAEALAGDGDDQASRGRWDDARRSYETAVADNPRFTPALAALGRLCEWGGLDRPGRPLRREGDD